MSETPDEPQTLDIDEPKWPTHCEHCGTALQSAVVDEFPDPESAHLQTASPATVVAQDYCPNPDCPAKQAAG